MQLSDRDVERLSGAHPDLQAVVKRAAELTTVPFTVGEVVRTVQQQRSRVIAGKSQTMRSRHVPENNACKMSCAVDLSAFPDRDGDGKIDPEELSWAWENYVTINKAMLQAAKELNVALEWGGMWKTLKDGVHWQLSWKAYP